MSDNCKDCFNGCLEKIPDNCIQYRGPDIPLLQIENNNPLPYVENQIFKYILSLIKGQGMLLDISGLTICTLISSYLAPNVTTFNVNDIVKAIFQSICDLQGQTTTIKNQLTVLEADYIVGTLVGVANSSDTHVVLQATIDKTIVLENALASLNNFLQQSGYVTSSNINSYITNYNTTVLQTNLISSKMIPYCPQPYFPPTSSIAVNFDSQGAGYLNSIWTKIYLCNGENGTPDLRGVTLVGATTGMAGLVPFNIAVDPALGNPNYTLKSRTGVNNVILSKLQIPIHKHENIVESNVIQTPHSHNLGGQRSYTGNNTPLTPGPYDQSAGGTILSSEAVNANVSVNTTIINALEGGNQPHTNTQPGIGCYYIMYIP